MPLVLSGGSALLPLQPLSQEVEANQPPVITTYGPDVEKWRRQLWDQMPPQLRQRPDAGTLLDKALYVIEGESGGNDRAVGDGGAAWGLAQSHHIPAGADPGTQIDDMWRLVSNNPDQWTDWGEGTTYQGKVFGALGNKPYGGGTGQAAGAFVGQQFGNKPQISQPNYIDTQGLPVIEQPPLGTVGGSVLGNSLRINDSGGVAGNYGPFDPRTGQDFVDAPMAAGNPDLQDFGGGVSGRGLLEAQRQGQDQLGNAAMALGTALPIIGAGPIAGPLGVIGGEAGHYVDERLGLPQVKLPVVGEVGPATVAGGLLGGLGDTGEGLVGGTVRNPVVRPRPNLRVVQPGETPPGAAGIIGKAGKPDPQEFLRKARELGMTDEEIRASFPGALEAGSGIDTGPQLTNRLDVEQAAKGAAAKRTYERIFAQHVDDLKAEGYSDAEARQIATGLASREARRAAAQAPEALPEQKPNVPYSESAAEEMRAAQERLRNPGNAAVENPVSGEPTGGTLAAEADRIAGRAPAEPRTPTLGDVALNAASDISRISANPYGEAYKFLKGQGKSRLQQAIDDEEQKQGKRRSPEENAALRAARTAGPDNAPVPREPDTFTGVPDQSIPPEQLNMLDDVLGQMSMQDVVTPGPGKLEIPPTSELTPEGRAILKQSTAAQEFERSQNVARQNVAQAAQRDTARFPAEGDVVEAARNLKPDQQASLLNKDWEPGTSMAQSAGRAMTDLISLPRSLQTRFDFSYPFRQGLLFVRRQGEFWDAFGKGLQSFWKDEDWKRAVEAEYMNAPYNPQTLKLTRWTGGNMAQREELFYNRLLDKFPAPMRKVFDASEEAATIFINKLRSDVTNNVARKWIREGLTPNDPEFIQDLNIFGNYVNRATGYGNLGELEKSIGLLNTVFYGARRNISMVQAPGYLFNSSARVRTEAWKDFMGLFGMGASTLALAQLTGIGDVNTFNPNSADWGKLKIGDTRLDIWGGYQQTARMVYKMVNGEFQNGPNFQDVWKNMLPYLGNKLSPQAGAAVSTMPEDVRRAIQPVDRPFKLTDALAPLAWGGLVQAVKEDGAVAGAIAATGLVGVGSQTYESQTDVRNKEAQQQFKTDYENLTPVQRSAVDKSGPVTKYQQENPSQYRQAKDRLLAPINQQEQQAEQAFKNNQLSKPLPDIWHEQSIQRQQVARDLADQFSDMFSGFDKTRYDKAVEGYYGKQVTGPDGQIDFDATESARQDYIKTLKPDEKQWLDEALQVSTEAKSPAHQKYLKYIDERKAAGYFNVDPNDPDRAKKLVELDRKNPLQDALNWYWKGGTVDNNRVPALNSPDAVSLALQMDSKRPVKYAGLGRPINQSPQVLQMWQDYGTRIQNYYTKTVPAYQDQIAQDMFGKRFADLPDRASRERVASNILTQVRRGSPELEAILQFMGDTADGNGDYAVSQEGAVYLRQMVQKYGNQPVNPKNASGRPSQFVVRQ